MLAEGIYDVTGECGCRGRGQGFKGANVGQWDTDEVGLPDLLRILAHGTLPDCFCYIPIPSHRYLFVEILHGRLLSIDFNPSHSPLFYLLGMAFTKLATLLIPQSYERPRVNYKAAYNLRSSGVYRNYSVQSTNCRYLNIFHLADNWPRPVRSKEPFTQIKNALKKILLLIQRE